MDTLIKKIPSTANVFKALLKADFIVQWRQRRAAIMSVIVPVIFIYAWKSLIPDIGGTGVLSICIAIGLPAIGLMGYSTIIARDRERGVFQRLRTTPITSWVIMASRIIVQLVIILLMTIITCIFAYYADHISISFVSVPLVLLAALIGGSSFLALGQFVVAFVKSSEAVNAASRLIYFPLSILGAIGAIGLFGNIVKNIVVWSPLGTTQAMLVGAMSPSTMTIHVFYAFLVTVGYTVFFAGIGIKWFQWSVN
jgi:ABC-2 type transport system permease protein